MISEWTSCLSDSSCPYMMKCMGLGVANLFECSKAKEITYCNSLANLVPQVYGALDGTYIPVLPLTDGQILSCGTFFGVNAIFLHKLFPSNPFTTFDVST